jgi:hypothetical protein
LPLSIWIGLAGIAACEILLLAEVRGWLPPGPWEYAGRLARANITPIAWCFYLLLLLGVIKKMDRTSYLVRYRNRFLVCWLWSVAAWCYFDWMNFYFMRDLSTGLRAWEYINLPPVFSDRLLGYLLAFGAIAPGMFLTAEVLQRLGFARLRTQPIPWSPRGKRLAVFAVFCLGLLLAPIPILVGGPISNLAIWVGTWALLDPLNLLCGRPSILRDWSRGRFGRTLALGAGGLWCGFLWEFWNYWAYTKWIYHLPFLGSWEHIKYFEMPVLGLVGFIAFGIETWTMWQTSLLLLSPFVEGERHTPSDTALAADGCF